MLLIANDDAGSTDEEAVDAAVRVLRTAQPVELVHCRDADQLHELLDGRTGQAVVVAGGDGSLHTAVQVLHRRGEAASTDVGLIPLGTGNDLARGLGIPVEPVAAAEAILSGRPRPLDLLVDDVDGVVVNAAHVGVGADAARAATPWKRWLGPLAFPVGAVVAGFQAPGWRLRVEADGRLLADGRKRLLMVGIANASTIGGGAARLGPHASPTDGRLDVVVSRSVGRLARFAYALRLSRGEHTQRDDVTEIRAASVSVSGEPFHLNVDGEVSGPWTRRTWRVVPAGWRLILPTADAAGADAAER